MHSTSDSQSNQGSGGAFPELSSQNMQPSSSGQDDQSQQKKEGRKSVKRSASQANLGYLQRRSRKQKTKRVAKNSSSASVLKSNSDLRSKSSARRHEAAFDFVIPFTQQIRSPNAHEQRSLEKSGRNLDSSQSVTMHSFRLGTGGQDQVVTEKMEHVHNRLLEKIKELNTKNATRRKSSKLDLILVPMEASSPLGISGETPIHRLPSSTYAARLEDINFEELQREERKMLYDEFVEEELEKKHPWVRFIANFIILGTDSMAYQAWKLTIIILSFISSFYYAFALSVLHEVTADEYASFQLVDLSFQLVFLLDIFLKFFIEHHSETSHKPERDITKLAALYIQGRFFIDLVTVFPFMTVAGSGIALEKKRLFLLVKLLRLYNGFHLLNYSAMMRELKHFQQTQLQTAITRDPKFGEKQDEDHTRITLMLLLKYLLKATYLIIVLISLSYLTGMIWLVFCEVASETSQTSFNNEFEIEGRSSTQLIVLMSYFMFTTLSTVGLGDFHPTNDRERILGSIILLFGVLVTSFIMDNFNFMMKQIRVVGDSFEESDKLSLFLTTLKKFNNDVTLPPQQLRELEAYFNYRWSNHRNFALENQEGRELLLQLPIDVQYAIYSDYLYRAFLNTFREQLRPSKEPLPYSLIYALNTVQISASKELQENFMVSQDKVHWGSDKFKKLIVSLLASLEPQYLQPNTLVLKEGEEINEVLFVLNASLKVGYSAPISENQLVSEEESLHSMASSAKYQPRYPVELEPGQLVLGLFEQLHELKSSKRYQIGQIVGENENEKTVDCFFIRKASMFKILQQEDIDLAVEGFKIKTLLNYIRRVHGPIRQEESIREVCFQRLRSGVKEFFKQKTASEKIQRSESRLLQVESQNQRPSLLSQSPLIEGLKAIGNRLSELKRNSFNGGSLHRQENLIAKSKNKQSMKAEGAYLWDEPIELLYFSLGQEVELEQMQAREKEKRRDDSDLMSLTQSLSSRGANGSSSSPFGSSQTPPPSSFKPIQDPKQTSSRNNSSSIEEPRSSEEESSQSSLASGDEADEASPEKDADPEKDFYTLKADLNLRLELQESLTLSVMFRHQQLHRQLVNSFEKIGQLQSQLWVSQLKNKELASELDAFKSNNAKLRAEIEEYKWNKFDQGGLKQESHKAPEEKSTWFKTKPFDAPLKFEDIRVDLNPTPAFQNLSKQRKVVDHHFFSDSSLSEQDIPQHSATVRQHDLTRAKSPLQDSLEREVMQVLHPSDTTSELQVRSGSSSLEVQEMPDVALPSMSLDLKVKKEGSSQIFHQRLPEKSPPPVAKSTTMKVVESPSLNAGFKSKHDEPKRRKEQPAAISEEPPSEPPSETPRAPQQPPEATALPKEAPDGPSYRKKLFK